MIVARHECPAVWTFIEGQVGVISQIAVALCKPPRRQNGFAAITFRVVLRDRSIVRKTNVA
jgi:hypothetical protein